MSVDTVRVERSREEATLEVERMASWFYEMKIVPPMTEAATFFIHRRRLAFYSRDPKAMDVK